MAESGVDQHLFPTTTSPLVSTSPSLHQGAANLRTSCPPRPAEVSEARRSHWLRTDDCDRLSRPLTSPARWAATAAKLTGSAVVTSACNSASRSSQAARELSSSTAARAASTCGDGPTPLPGPDTNAPPEAQPSLARKELRPPEDHGRRGQFHLVQTAQQPGELLKP